MNCGPLSLTKTSGIPYLLRISLGIFIVGVVVVIFTSSFMHQLILNTYILQLVPQSPYVRETMVLKDNPMAEHQLREVETSNSDTLDI